MVSLFRTHQIRTENKIYQYVLQFNSSFMDSSRQLWKKKGCQNKSKILTFYLTIWMIIYRACDQALVLMKTSPGLLNCNLGRW